MAVFKKNKQLVRILDANANRLKEALRVIEDVARFTRNHARLTRSTKSLRHEAQQALLAAPVSYREMLEARDSSRDVGRRSRIADKSKVKAIDILVSNFKRAEESARVLEEFFKLFSEKTSARFQKLRFKIYVIEKEIIR